MSAITLTRNVGGSPADALAVVLQDSTGTFGIKRNDTDAVVVAARTAVVHSSTGVYSYDTSALESTLAYTAVWMVTTDAGVEYIQELILPSAPNLTTLADVEREFAARVGPYERRTVAAGATSKTFVITKLKTSLDLGGVEDLYVLRRGFMSDGTAIAGFNDDDRQRIIVTYTPADGLIEVDRDYTTAPVAGEDIELHYLDPENELRPVVQAALTEHCRIGSRAAIRLNSFLAEQDITSYCPWITAVGQIWELSSAFTNSVFVPFLVNWWKDYARDGHLWVKMGPVPYPNSLLIDHWRWASTLVNGSYSAEGPTNDADILHVSPMYAAAAAHDFAFLYGRVRPRIMAAAKDGLYINQQQASAVFQDSARRHFRPMRRRVMVPAPGLDANLLVNGPTLSV